jgi:hypothetical protein
MDCGALFVVGEDALGKGETGDVEEGEVDMLSYFRSLLI